MANIHLNWRMLKVPLERIKNPSTRSSRIAYDYAMSWRDQAMFLLRAAAKGQAPAGVSVFIHIELFFKPAKDKDNPADLAQDVDNPSKALLDAIQKAGLVVNDKQVTCLVMEKACAAAETHVMIRSIAVGRPQHKLRWLQQLAARAEG